jgi:hypothetical protein
MLFPKVQNIGKVLLPIVQTFYDLSDALTTLLMLHIYSFEILCTGNAYNKKTFDYL